MKKVEFEKNSEEWQQFRKGKITGSKLRDIYQTDTPLKKDVLDELDRQEIRHTKSWTIPTLMELLPHQSILLLQLRVAKKVGYYELMAERLAVEHENDEESPMERGHSLEREAIDSFTDHTGYEVNTDCVVWISDESEFIAVSPDGEIDEYSAVEVKCLSSAKHLQAYFEKAIPSEYEAQVAQYFVVNEKLQQLHFVFYDPRIPAKPLHVIVVDRSEITKEIEQYKQYQKEVLADIEKQIIELTF